MFKSVILRATVSVHMKTLFNCISRNVEGYLSYDWIRGKRLHRCTRAHLYCVRNILLMRCNTSRRRSEQALITLGMVTPVLADPHLHVPCGCEPYIRTFSMLANHAFATHHSTRREMVSASLSSYITLR